MKNDFRGLEILECHLCMAPCTVSGAEDVRSRTHQLHNGSVQSKRQTVGSEFPQILYTPPYVDCKIARKQSVILLAHIRVSTLYSLVEI